MKYKKNEYNFVKEIGRGSNSVVYDIERDSRENSRKYVAKCSLNNSNYISFNLQRDSYERCSDMDAEGIIVPKVYDYFKDDQIGDILVLDKIENVYDIDFMINQGFYYSEIIVKDIAKAIAILHNKMISGYDVEFYWNAEFNKLVLLDLGPSHTFGVDTVETIRKHWEIEQENYMGLWNIESQILDFNIAKEIFKNKGVMDVKIDVILDSINSRSNLLHVENVAQIHALSIFGKIGECNRFRLFEIFEKTYKHYCNDYNFLNHMYINNLKKCIKNKITKASAKLYYSLENVLSEESCCTELR